MGMGIQGEMRCLSGSPTVLLGLESGTQFLPGRGCQEEKKLNMAQIKISWVVDGKNTL